jgi:hypothetical protein
MEEDIYEGKSSALSFTKKMEKIEKRLEEAVEVAEERMNYEAAHNDEVLTSLGVVSEFIKKKKRVCYGGTAMNAILPDKKKFYNKDLDLPDYDFYTPDIEKDVEELVKDLREAGFKEVYHRVGMHEGTKKILVNFVPVADISLIDPELFQILLKRSVVKEGIHYTDPDILRMMMYLELSRPKGEVGRWGKVFERLQLINSSFPIESDGHHRCKETPSRSKVTSSTHHILLDFIIGQQRILCNGPVLSLYTRGIQKGDATYKVNSPGEAGAHAPMLFTSPVPKEDAIRLKKLLAREGEVKIFVHKKRGEIVPERYEVRVNGEMVCTILEEVACHSYNNFPTDDGRILYIGSPEFLITLYLSLHIFTKHSAEILGPDVPCLVNQVISLAEKNYLSHRSQFPAFSLNCRGHQTGYASLVRQKVLRIKEAKAAAGILPRSLSKKRTSKAKTKGKAKKGRKKTQRKQKEKA